jgi:hypothetical protein
VGKRKKLGFVERRRLRRQIEGYLLDGVAQLEAGAALPIEDHTARAWMPPGLFTDFEVTAPTDRLDAIATKHGVTRDQAMLAALELGRRARH